MRTIVATILLLTVNCAYAHDHDRPDLDAWFEGLTNQYKVSCCHVGEGSTLSDIDWDIKDGRYRVRIPTPLRNSPADWVDVPPEAVITEPNLDGRTVVWPLYGYLGVTIRCFMRGPMM